MATVNPAVSSSLKWAVAGWVPGRPRRDADIRSLLRFGGTVTLNSLVIYLGYNLEKVLLGRFGGPDVLGLYSRAYYLAAIPTDNINSTAGAVGFAALSRLQSDPERLKRFFLKGYSIVISVTLPTTIFCALFADDLILVLLGAKWGRAVDIFRLLTPTVLIFGMLNPWGWLLPAIGLQERSLKIALVIAPTVICAYLAGLPYGAKGVAVAYSAALSLLVVPLIMWCVRGTIFTSWDVWSAIRVPLLATLAGGSFAFAVRSCLDPYLSHLLMLMVGGAAMALSYLGMLLFVLGQKEMYLGLIRELKRKTPGEVAAGVEN